MRVKRLVPEEHLYAVSGLGARTILEPERPASTSWSSLSTSGSDGRARAAPRPRPGRTVASHAETRERPLTDEARAALDAMPTEGRGRPALPEKPSPLVRDAVRGYRTGRLDRVIAGDFDLF